MTKEPGLGTAVMNDPLLTAQLLMEVGEGGWRKIDLGFAVRLAGGVACRDIDGPLMTAAYGQWDSDRGHGYV